MKKILIGILILIILIFLYMILINGISLGFIKIESVQGIRMANKQLENDFSAMSKMREQYYPEQVNALKESISKLVETKERYDSKVQYANSEINLDEETLKVYDTVFLWTNVDGYAKKHGLDLKMDLRNGILSGSYNIDFILTGSYVGITNFIYEIENDDVFNFRIENFMIVPGGASEEDQTPSAGDTTNLRATFTVVGVRINFN